MLRELSLGPEHQAQELARLTRLLGNDQDIMTLRWQLVNSLRDGSQDLADPLLQEHLRQTVVNQIAIDQPKYSGYRRALEQIQ